VIFCLFRDLRRPKQAEGDIPEGQSHVIPGSLPAFQDLQPFDAENKWALTALVQVSDGNQPLLMQRGLDQLAQVKQDFAGILEFVMVPRRQLDTRVLSYNQSIRT
jgi:Med18 protein